MNIDFVRANLVFLTPAGCLMNCFHPWFSGEHKFHNYDVNNLFDSVGRTEIIKGTKSA